MVDISPDGGIFGIFRNLNYKHWYALGEFVDNAVGAWEQWDEKATGLPKPKQVKVDINIELTGVEPFIEIRDNSTGIALKDFSRAFKVASPPLDKSGLHEFGMGMKTAAFWFSNNWSVRTSYAGDDVARTMNFNLSKILNDGSRNIEPVSQPIRRDSHFTTVRLEELNQIPRGKTVGKIKEHLTDIYRIFIREGKLELVYNGEVLAYKEPAILTAPKVWAPGEGNQTWKEEFSFTLPSTGHKVRGWFGLLNKGDTKYAGFALFRKNRLILGSADDAYRPEEIFKKSNSFTHQRLIGEVHLDPKIQVSYSKDGFLWDETEEEELIAALKQALGGDLNFLKQAEEYRSRGERIEPKVVEQALEAVRTTLAEVLPGTIETIAPSVEDITLEVPEALSTPSASATERRDMELRVETATHGSWLVRLIALQDDSMSDLFKVGSSVMTVDGSRRAINKLDVHLNFSHPFVQKYVGPNLENSEFIVAFVSGLAISLSLGRSVGAKSGFIVQYLNDILRFGASL